MKEKIYKKLERIILSDNIATTWKIKCYKFAAEIELLINQEVEKRIKERTPSEEEIEKHFTAPHYHYEKGHYYKAPWEVEK